MPAPPASVSPPEEHVKQKAGDAVSPPRLARARLWVGGCHPKASACQQTLHGAGLMFAAGSPPGSGCSGKGGFNDLPDLPHYQR